MAKATDDHTPDERLILHCAAFFKVDDQLRDWGRGAIELDDDQSAAAISAYWRAGDAIARTAARTEAGLRDKARVANAAAREHDDASPRRFALIASALGDLVAAWDAEGEGEQDAKLIRLHHKLTMAEQALARIEAERSGGSGITPESEAKEQRISDAEDHYAAIVGQMANIPANGVAGQRAKAASLFLVLEHYLCHRIGSGLNDIASGEMGDEDHRLSVSLARDLLGYPVDAP